MGYLSRNHVGNSRAVVSKASKSLKKFSSAVSGRGLSKARVPRPLGAWPGKVVVSGKAVSGKIQQKLALSNCWPWAWAT
eukprot:9074071-Prorocentrum_lima.AAC.1